MKKESFEPAEGVSYLGSISQRMEEYPEDAEELLENWKEQQAELQIN